MTYNEENTTSVAIDDFQKRKKGVDFGESYLNDDQTSSDDDSIRSSKVKVVRVNIKEQERIAKNKHLTHLFKDIK